jgi:poly-D-alanine transfer protein DltD
MSFPEILAKYQAVFLLAFNAFIAWCCWTLREVAKTEVNKAVEEAKAALTAQHTRLLEKVEVHHDTLGRHGAQIEEIRADIKDLPTKADLEQIRGEIRTVGKDAASSSAGVLRIESYFLERGVRGDR